MLVTVVGEKCFCKAAHAAMRQNGALLFSEAPHLKRDVLNIRCSRNALFECLQLLPGFRGCTLKVVNLSSITRRKPG